MTEEFSLSEIAPNRRQIMWGVAALAAGAMLPSSVPAVAAQAASESPPPGFLALSSRLTGVALDVVDQEQAAQVWSGLLPVLGREKLAAIMRVAAETPEDSALFRAFERHGVLSAAQALTRTWHTGYWDVMPPAEGSNVAIPAAVLFYDDALAWRSCPFTKPAANCGGVTGYWEKPWEPSLSPRNQESKR